MKLKQIFERIPKFENRCGRFCGGCGGLRNITLLCLRKCLGQHCSPFTKQISVFVAVDVTLLSVKENTNLHFCTR